jgi:hypothetical protein
MRSAASCDSRHRFSWSGLVKVTLILLFLGLILSGAYFASWRWRPSQRQSWRWVGTWLAIGVLLAFALWLYGYADLVAWLLRLKK